MEEKEREKNFQIRSGMRKMLEMMHPAPSSRQIDMDVEAELCRNRRDEIVGQIRFGLYTQN